MKLWEAGSRVAMDGGRGDAGREGDGRPDPLTVLRRRYAAGDLDEVEFEERLETLLCTAGAEVHGVGSRRSVSRAEKSAAGGSDRGVEEAPGTSHVTGDD